MSTTYSRRSFLRRAPFLGVVPGMAAPVSRSLEQRLLAEFEKLEIADTHEHFFDEAERLRQRTDFFALMAQSYSQADLASAGIPPEQARLIRNEQAADLDRWRAFEPYWKYCRFTGYGQALRLAIHDLYGGKEPSAATIGEINAAIRARNRPGLYRYILRERARIRFCVEDDSCGGCIHIPSSKENFELFVLARRFDKFITPATPSDVRGLEQMSGVSITTLDGLKRAVEANFQQNLGQGMKVVKIALAYIRELRFEEADQTAAERDFEVLMRQERPLPEGFRSAFTRPFRRLEDHMFHHVMKLADAHHTPVQIHTGLFAGGGNRLTNSNPTLLINTFSLYPRIQFDIFHLSYPYQQELGVLAKSFANVHADFCWAWVVAPTAARRALDEFLDSVPVNKILGFGGDYKYPELSYAHAVMARRAVAATLAGKVETSFCTEQEAVEIGKLLLYENAARLFSWTGR